LSADGLLKAAELAKWRRRLNQNWGQVRIENVETHGADPMHVGADLDVRVRVHLGEFSPGDVEVQLYHGPLDTLGEISEPQTAAIGPVPSSNGDGSYLFHGLIPCQRSGQYGFSVRVLPKHTGLPHLFEPGLVTWG
jgi:starch phosphorylase